MENNSGFDPWIVDADWEQVERERKVAKQIKADTGADYIRLSIVGVHVPHVHVHLIPRFLHDKPIAD